MTKTAAEQLDALRAKKKEAEERARAEQKELDKQIAAVERAEHAEKQKAVDLELQTALDILKRHGSQFLNAAWKTRFEKVLGESGGGKKAKAPAADGVSHAEHLLAGLPKSFALGDAVQFRRPGTEDKWKGGTKSQGEKKAWAEFEEWTKTNSSVFFDSRAGQAQRKAAEASPDHPLKEFLTRYPIQAFASAFSAEQREKAKK